VRFVGLYEESARLGLLRFVTEPQRTLTWLIMCFRDVVPSFFAS
jgi:hypothetical protein